MPTMFIMVGIPGSGKTRVARALAAKFKAETASADGCTGLYDEKGFHPELLGAAHAACFLRVATAVREKRHIVIDNTNLVVQEVTPYVLLGMAFHYDVEIVTVPCDQKVAYARQTHGVPLKKHEQMARQFMEMRLPCYWSARSRPAKHVLREHRLFV